MVGPMGTLVAAAELGADGRRALTLVAGVLRGPLCLFLILAKVSRYVALTAGSAPVAMRPVWSRARRNPWD